MKNGSKEGRTSPLDREVSAAAVSDQRKCGAHLQPSARPLPEDHSQDRVSLTANGRPGPSQVAPPANSRRAHWDAARGEEGFRPCQERREG